MVVTTTVAKQIFTALALFIAAIASTVCPASPADCQLITIADWPVRLERNKLIVDGTINGQKIGIVLDTGAERSFILRSAATRLGLTLRRAKGLRLFGVGGETEVDIAHVDEFKISDTTLKNWQVIVAGEQDLGDNVALLLGEDFFHRTNVEFDLAHGAVRLYQLKECDGVPLAYWASTGVNQVEIEAVDDNHPHIFLTVRINGQPMRALLDSGAGTSMLVASDAALLGVTPQTPGVVGGGSSTGLGVRRVNSWIGPFQSFAIGDETIKEPKIRFSDLWKDTTYTPAGSMVRQQVGAQPMLLGADFLIAHRVFIAHDQRKVYFTYAGGTMFQAVPALETRDSTHQDSGAKPAGEIQPR